MGDGEMDQEVIAASPPLPTIGAWPRLLIERSAIPYLVIAALLVALTILAIHYAAVVAERNDYLELIRVYGLGT
jgi:hypothetical protein